MGEIERQNYLISLQTNFPHLVCGKNQKNFAQLFFPKPITIDLESPFEAPSAFQSFDWSRIGVKPRHVISERGTEKKERQMEREERQTDRRMEIEMWIERAKMKLDELIEF